MIFDYIKSTVENIKERIKNPFTERNATPFAGAFIIALIIYNWHLVFSLINFDSFETRLTKIQIIRNYLIEKNWVNRIGMPVIIAFGSIIFYQVFSNISLGLTIFFNRWFRSMILTLTDKSQLISRKEFDQNVKDANKLQKRYNDLRKTLNESQSEVGDYEKQLAEKEKQIIKIKEEKEAMFKELETVTQKLDTKEREEVGVKILFAKYGKNETFVDVTNSVAKLITSKGSLEIENAELGTDPKRYFVKQLFVVYKSGNEVKTLMANESEKIELKDNALIVFPTEKSEKKQLSIQNEKTLAGILRGEWILKYTKDNSVASERAIIDETARYFVNGVYSFHLNNIKITNNQISFNKIGLAGQLHAKETLIINNPNLITGNDTQGYALEYKKM